MKHFILYDMNHMMVMFYEGLMSCIYNENIRTNRERGLQEAQEAFKQSPRFSIFSLISKPNHRPLGGGGGEKEEFPS